MSAVARMLRLIEMTDKGRTEVFTVEEMETIKGDVAALFTVEAVNIVTVLMDQILVLKSHT